MDRCATPSLSPPSLSLPSFATPQDAEDAYYDALEAGDIVAMAEVWETSDRIVCLLPMTPLAIGPEVLRLWRALFERGHGFEIEVRHRLWIESGELALHLIEERPVAPPGGPVPSVIYATNAFRHGADGWRLLLHQNSPAPPVSPGTPSNRRTAPV